FIASSPASGRNRRGCRVGVDLSSSRTKFCEHGNRGRKRRGRRRSVKNEIVESRSPDDSRSSAVWCRARTDTGGVSEILHRLGHQYLLLRTSRKQFYS